MDGAAHQGPDDFSVAPIGDSFDTLTDELRACVKTELEPGERLLWSARSEPPLEGIGFAFFAFSALAVVLLGLGLIGMTRGLSRQRLNDGNEFVAGMAFAGFSFAVVLGLIGNWRSCIKERERSARMLYAITDRRAIIWAPEPKGSAVRIRTIPRGEIYNLVRLENPDGSGSVLFSSTKDATAGDIYAEWNPFGFRHVDDVRRVELLVRNNLLGSERVS
jgi:hypothetical protein